MAAGRNAAEQQRTLLLRVLRGGEPGRLHLRFDAAVIDRYRSASGARLLRTRTVGRVAFAGSWSVDVGIVEDAGEVHLPVQDLIDRVPEREWAHWVEHLVTSAVSENFVAMRMTAAACIDDGETEPWA